jgi:dTDP-4-dehydrorhamnose 3,5-epimerase-like enzyme
MTEPMTHDEYTQAVDEGCWPAETRVPLPEMFVNDAGAIQNLLLKPLKSVAVIVSRRGAVRANHYHKTDWHYAYVISGHVLYFERAIGQSEIGEPKYFGPGQMFFTPPMREHAMLFGANSTILTFAKNVRNHEEHEADVVRVDYITPEIAGGFVPSGFGP